MYSIIIVDDESRIRDTIKNIIPWNEYGFEIIGVAENGLDALTLLEENSVDVVITDIKMPYMDGIELIKEIRKNNPTTNVVILSGHDEFSYAQTAIKLNVTEYVLKPVSKNDIIELLKKIKANLDTEIARKTDKERLMKLYNNLIPAMKEKIINELYLGNLNSVKTQIKEYELPYDNDYFMTCIIEPEKKGNNELNLLTIQDIINTNFTKNPNIIKSILNNTMVLTFYYKNKGKEDIERPLFKKRTLKHIEEINQFIQFYTKNKCNIGISNITEDIENLSLSYKQCINALNYKIYYKDQNIFYIEDLEPINSIEVTDNIQDKYIEDILTLIKLGNKIEIEKAIDNLYSKEATLNPLDIETINLKVISSLTNLALSYNLVLSKYSSLIKKISEINTVNETLSKIKELANKLNSEIQEKRESSNIKFVEDAKRLIEKNYKDKNFNQDIICDILGVSNAYFSSTFKKETNTPFTKALTITRINQAKKLINQGSFKSYQIAEEVGFSDSNYFSFCFKKITGDSPSAYKQKMKK
ncbi:MAG: response regulator [Pleomorphochaeta sp.]